MVFIYAKQNTPRLAYSTSVIFTEVLGISHTITHDASEFESYIGTKINYSNLAFNSILQIKPSGLLEESVIRKQNPTIGKWNEIPALFANESSPIPFDLFSAVFYLIARYEEYLPFDADEHERFEATQSIAYKENFLRLPIVELWCKRLAEILGVSGDCPGINPQNYRFRLTIDVDYAWWFKHNGIIRTAARLVKNIVSLNFNQLTQQIAVLIGAQPDPGDTYTYLEDVQKNLAQKINYFVLVGTGSKYDKNISINRKPFRKLVEKLSIDSIVGIHPSYASNNSYDRLEKETRQLRQLTKKNIIQSRQHFLRMTLPKTYQHLIHLGIEEDFTMGYGMLTGFRAGIARSFPFYDLTIETETPLRIVPFALMDRTLLSYMKLSPEEAEAEFKYYTEVVKSVGGELVCLWHNNSLSNWGEWKGWKKVFESMIELNSTK